MQPTHAPGAPAGYVRELLAQVRTGAGTIFGPHQEAYT